MCEGREECSAMSITVQFTHHLMAAEIEPEIRNHEKSGNAVC